MTRLLHHAVRLAPVLCSVAIAACGGDQRSPEISLPEGWSVLRLIDVLDLAEISSPLAQELGTEAEPAPPRERMEWTPGAEDDPGDGGCRIVSQQAAESHLECDSGPGDEPFHFSKRFGVAGAAFYRFSALVESPAPRCVRLSVQTAGAGNLLVLGPGTDLQTVEKIVHTRARHAGISLTLRKRKLTPTCRVQLRRVVLERVPNDSPAILAQMRAEAILPGSRPDLGIAKRGKLLPAHHALDVAPPFDENFSTREALLAPSPTDVRFRIRVPRGARLLLSYGMHSFSSLGESVRFRVGVRTDGAEEESLLDRELVVDEESWHWHEAEIDLAPFGGRTVELRLLTTSPAGERGLGVWGDPVIDVPRQAGDPPNVVLIGIDTLRADRMSTYGHSQLTSPRISSFAADGVLFWNAISQSAWTVPSFFSIFSGLTPRRHGVMATSPPWSHAHYGLAGQVPTLPEQFRSHGWSTHAVMEQPILYRNPHLEKGFERYFNVPVTGSRCEDILEKSVRWLDRHHDRRFFLFLHFNDPHQPFTQPEEWVRPSTRRQLEELGLEMPLWVDKLPGHPRPGPGVRQLAYDLYDEEVEYVDSCVGGFLDELKRRGLYEHSVIALVSDHGEAIWERGDHFGHGSTFYEDEVIRVPMMVKPAGELRQAGTVVQAQVRTMDLMPTLLELAGVELPSPGLEAASLVPTWTAGRAGDRVALSMGLLAESVRSTQWKYLRKGRRQALYDLPADPGETNSVAAEHPERLEDLRLIAIRHTLENAVSGHYLLITVDDPGPHRATARAGDDERAVAAKAGRSTGRVFMFERLELAGDGELRIELATRGRPDSEVTLSRALAVPLDEIRGLIEQPGIYLLQGLGSGPGVEADEGQGLEERQLEALRALGYID